MNKMFKKKTKLNETKHKKICAEEIRKTKRCKQYITRRTQAEEYIRREQTLLYWMLCILRGGPVDIRVFVALSLHGILHTHTHTPYF